MSPHISVCDETDVVLQYNLRAIKSLTVSSRLSS